MEVGFRSGLFQFLKSLISQMPIGILVLSTVINSLSVIRMITLISLANLLSEAVNLVGFKVSMLSYFFKSLFPNTLTPLVQHTFPLSDKRQVISDHRPF